MPHTDALSHRFSHPAAAPRPIVEWCQALLRPAFVAVAAAWAKTWAKTWMARHDECLLTEMSDHRLNDLGIGRDNIRGAGNGRFEQWRYPHWRYEQWP